MIQRIFFENFKSFRRAELPLAPLTFLVGANGSGKSNAVEAIRVLSWLGSGLRLEDLPGAIIEGTVSLRGALPDLGVPGRQISLGCRFLSPWVPAEVDYSVSLAVKNEDLQIVGERLESPAFGVLYETPRSWDEVREARSFYGGPQSEQAAISEARSALSRTLFLSPDPRRMRGYSSRQVRSLEINGSNLSSVLYRLCSEKGKENQILGFLRSVQTEGIHGLSFVQNPRSEIMLQLHEVCGRKTVPREAAVLSDGTLRLLAVIAALYSAPEGSLVILEEIDSAVYPNLAEPLISGLRGVARQRGLTLLLPTHNPALLDALPLETVADVVACYRDPEEGDSRLLRLEDLESYPELIARGSMGALATEGHLDRHLKTPELRDRDKMIEKGLIWIEEFRKRVRSA